MRSNILLSQVLLFCECLRITVLKNRIFILIYNCRLFNTMGVSDTSDSRIGSGDYNMYKLTYYSVI